MISDAIAMYELIRRIYGEHKIVAALFDWKGERLEGDERLKVNLEMVGKGGDLWFYQIEPLEDYQFIRIPVNVGAVIESLGTFEGEKTPQAKLFRYIPAFEGIIRAIIPNVKVNFMVFAYKPSDLLATGKGKM